MMRWILAAGAAALAISSPTLAEKGGQGGGKQKGQTAKVQKGGGGQADRGKGGGQAKSQAVRGHGGHDGDRMRLAQGGEFKQTGQGKVKSDSRGRDKVRTAHDNRGPDKVKTARLDDGGKVKDRGRDIDVVGVDRGRHARVVRINDHDDDFDFVPRWGANGLHRGFVDGCPPGLAKKGTGCLPPGQFKKLVGTPLTAGLVNRRLSWPYRDWYRDDANFMYRWDDDYIYRVRRNGGLIDALFPFANNDYYYYPMGAPYPDSFNFYNVPYQYQAFYPDGGDNWYRYGDGAIYMVDPQTRAINGIAALLTGTPMGIGQPLPPAYSVYNVPYSYRSQYFDTPDAWYRYNDGYVYRVDPATQLITAIISLIA
jgi:hypothetical protein